VRRRDVQGRARPLQQDVVFVVTTVPRKGWGRYKGKKYFAAHLDTTLTQAPTVPIIYVQGDDASSDEATRIVGAAHGDGDENGKGNTPGVPRPVLYVRPPPWPEHRWKPPTKKHTHPKWFAKENWHWSWSVLLAHFAGEGIGKGCGGASTSDGKDSTAIGSFRMRRSSGRVPRGRRHLGAERHDGAR
jgi:hypothetical protein